MAPGAEVRHLIVREAGAALRETFGNHPNELFERFGADIVVFFSERLEIVGYLCLFGGGSSLRLGL